MTMLLSTVLAQIQHAKNRWAAETARAERYAQQRPLPNAELMEEKGLLY